MALSADEAARIGAAIGQCLGARAVAQEIGATAYAPPGLIWPTGRSGVIDGADPRAQLKVISFIVAKPDACELLSRRNSTFEPSQPGAEDTRHWTSRPSVQRSPEFHSGPCQAMAPSGKAKLAAAASASSV